MTSIPSKPQDFHVTLETIGNCYQIPGKMPNDELITTLFEGLKKSSPSLEELSENEKKTLTRLYHDVSKMPCSQKPDWVQKYKELLPKMPLSSFHFTPSTRHSKTPKTATTSPTTVDSDPLLKEWKKAPHNSPEHKAYTAILSYKEQDSNLQDIDIPPLDLSKLSLTELPARLFTDPIFAKTNICWDRITKLPPELTIGSLRNIELYEKLTKHLSHVEGKAHSARAVLTNPDLAHSILAYSSPGDSNTSGAVNQAFWSGSNIAIYDRLQNYKKDNYHELPPEIQKELDQVDELSQTERKALDLKIEKKKFIAPILSTMFITYIKDNPREHLSPDLNQFALDHKAELDQIFQSHPLEESIEIMFSKYILNGSWRLNDYEPSRFLKAHETMLEKVVDSIPSSEKEKFLKIETEQIKIY